MSLRRKPEVGICLFLFWIVMQSTVCVAQPMTGESFGRLYGRVVDAVTGLPTACTIKITDANGQTVIENPAFAEGFRCDGHFEKRLPAGRTRLRVTRGFETRVVEQWIEIPAESTAEVKITLHRVVDLRRRGWYGGDSHVHMIHGEKTLPVDFDDVALVAQAEDLQYMSLAQAWAMDAPTPEKLQKELETRSKPD